MLYEKSLIHITKTLESSDSMYSLVCLKASSLVITINKVRCYLDGHYLLCLSVDDVLTVISGDYHAINIHFRPYFYNVNLDHKVIGLSMYQEMRSLYGYPDFHLFRHRDESFFGVLSLTKEEYENAFLDFIRAEGHINGHKDDFMWSCRTRSDIISILRIAEGSHLSDRSEKGMEILRYIRNNIGKELSLPHLCQQFKTNRTTLNNTVKKLTGMSPVNLIIEERLNQSRPDLLFTYVPVHEIAQKYGFKDTNYYIRAFKKRFGKTPLQYRTEGRAKRIEEEHIYHERAKNGEPPKV